MDSATLPAATPAAKPPALTVDTVISAWMQTHGKSVEASLRLGALARRFLVARLKHATDAGERRRMRAAAVRQIEERLHAAGLRGDALGVSRHIRCAAVVALLRGDCPQIPAWRALVALGPLVRRSNTDESWLIALKEHEKARALFRAVVERRPSVEQIVSEVRKILGRKAPVRAGRPVDISGEIRRRIATLDSLAYALEVRQAIEQKIRELNPAFASAAA